MKLFYSFVKLNKCIVDFMLMKENAKKGTNLHKKYNGNSAGIILPKTLVLVSGPTQCLT